MEKLFSWLRVEPSGVKLWKFFAGMVALLFCCSLISEMVFDVLGVHWPIDKNIDYLLMEHPIFFLGLLLPLLAAIEELFFRFPLVLFLCSDAPPRILLLLVLLLSIVFGRVHGSWGNVLIQGVMGVVLCMVFLKCGGMQKKYGKAFLSSTFVHFTYNFVVFGLVFLF